jgi:hypothetical protein
MLQYSVLDEDTYYVYIVLYENDSKQHIKMLKDEYFTWKKDKVEI